MELDGWTWEDATIKHPAAMNLNWPNIRFDFSKNAKKNDKLQREAYNKSLREINILIRNVRAYHHRKNAKERKAEHKQKSDLRLESMIPFVIYKEPMHIKANNVRQIEAAIKWSIEQDLNIVIVGLMRKNQPIVPSSDDHMLPGDEVYFVVDTDQVGRAMVAFGHEETEARRLLIFGGGNIGFSLAQEIEREHHWVRTKIIELNSLRAETIAMSLEKTMVLHGDALDSDILEESGVNNTETVVAVTGASSVVYRCKEIENALNSNFSLSAINNVRIKSSGLNSDIHGSSEYRAHLIAALAKKAVQAC